MGLQQLVCKDMIQEFHIIFRFKDRCMDKNAQAMSRVFKVRVCDGFEVITRLESENKRLGRRLRFVNVP